MFIVSMADLYPHFIKIGKQPIYMRFVLTFNYGQSHYIYAIMTNNTQSFCNMCRRVIL